MKRIKSEEDREIAEKLVKQGLGKIRKYKGENAVVLTKKGREFLKQTIKWFNQFWKIAPSEWKKLMAEEDHESV